MPIDEAYLRKIVQSFNHPDDSDFQEELLQLRGQSPEHETFYQEVLSLWTSSSELKDFEHMNVAEATERLSVKLKQTDRYLLQAEHDGPTVLTWLARVAAVVLLGIAGTWRYYASQPVYLVKTTQGQPDSLLLADGSKLFLDKYTSIAYPESFGEERVVKLEKGNAFFSIARDPKHPFIVGLGKSSVTVLGTSFNIENSPEEIYVSVKTGTVRFEQPEGGKTILEAGHGIVYHPQTNSLTPLDVTNRNADAWLTHRLDFEDASLREVITSLEDYYHVSFSLTDSIANFRKFNASFKDNSLDEVLDVLEATYPIKIETKDNLVVIKSVHDK